MDKYQHVFLGIARGLFMNRLHVLRLTEVVRLGIRPNEDGVLLLPPELDEEMKKQAFDYILATFPECSLNGNTWRNWNWKVAACLIGWYSRNSVVPVNSISLSRSPWIFAGCAMSWK